MALWERNVYAVPGEVVHWPQEMKVSRPFFYHAASVMLDDLKVNEVCSVKPFTRLLVVACFPDGVPRKPQSRGAIVLVPDRGLWWWRWP